MFINLHWCYAHVFEPGILLHKIAFLSKEDGYVGSVYLLKEER